MTLAQIIGFAINASMFLIVFALGLRATFDDVTYLFRRPSLFVRSILSMNIIMLAIVVLLSLLFNLHPAIKIALVTLAVSPVPPVLPGKQEKAGGSASYTIGLLVATALVSIVLVPLSISLLGSSFNIDMHEPESAIASVVLISIIIPLVAGVVVRHFAPDLANRIERLISRFATLLLIVAVVPVLFIAWHAIWALIGNGIVIMLVLFTLIGVAVGHFLGGPDPDDRTVLALATGTRHPGVAIAIASLNFPNEKAVMAVVLYHLAIGAIVSIPYVRWRTRIHAALRPEMK
ncbi:bile acid:sodium symporter family protein [Phyllobacterium chamaecytisi]|uniref:bile acid:sodium symporter family protein n=1 Tax=Phyllobacterium chamaecytisi TaxID=2876082 RepID=UPI001CCB0C5F|nr:Na+-dependent transporter [Phyllobacterium sp. KW56]MBZ9601224.1 Na+-dependent transporter [Phyllobacterium sp. KW56]